MAFFAPGQGMVTSNVQGSTYQKPPEDDPTTLLGYKARLAAQRAEEEASYRSRAGYDRQLQLQYEQEDRRRQEAEMRRLEGPRQKAFEAYYRPILENEARTQWATGHMGGRSDPGYHSSKRPSIYSNPVYGRPDLAPPGIPTARGTPVYGGYWPGGGNQIQQALNTIWNRTRAIEQSGMAPRPMTAFAPTAAQVYGYGGSTG